MAEKRSLKDFLYVTGFCMGMLVVFVELLSSFDDLYNMFEDKLLHFGYFLLFCLFLSLIILFYHFKSFLILLLLKFLDFILSPFIEIHVPNSWDRKTWKQTYCFSCYVLSSVGAGTPIVKFFVDKALRAHLPTFWIALLNLSCFIIILYFLVTYQRIIFNWAGNHPMPFLAIILMILQIVIFLAYIAFLRSFPQVIIPTATLWVSLGSIICVIVLPYFFLSWDDFWLSLPVFVGSVILALIIGVFYTLSATATAPPPLPPHSPNFETMRISTIVYVRSIRESVEFYTLAFGADIIIESKYYAELQISKSSFFLFPLTVLDPPKPSFVLILETGDLPQAVARAKAAGGADVEQHNGLAMVTDPSSYIWIIRAVIPSSPNAIPPDVS